MPATAIVSRSMSSIAIPVTAVPPSLNNVSFSSFSSSSSSSSSSFPSSSSPSASSHSSFSSSSSKTMSKSDALDTAPRTLPDAYVTSNSNPMADPLFAYDPSKPTNEPMQAGVKYACASCIRGHRTSSCSHKDGSKGPLYPIRSKGRPPTQCDFCRQKRRERGRHVRCDCAGKKQTKSVQPSVPSRPPLGTTSSATTAPSPLHNWPESKRRKLENSDSSTSNPHTVATPSTQSLHSPSFLSDSSGPSLQSPSLVQQPARSDISHHDNNNNRSNDSSSPPAALYFPPNNQLPPIHHVQARVPDEHVSTSLPSFNFEMPSSVGNRFDSATRISSMSLSSLMNPCQCKTSGFCTCCRGSNKSEKSLNHAKSSSSQGQPSLLSTGQQQSSCCTEDQCCRDQADQECCQPVEEEDICGGPSRSTVPSPSLGPHLTFPFAESSSTCTSNSSGSRSAPSIELLLRAVDMSAEFVPPCLCKDSCKCSTCISGKGDKAGHMESASPIWNSNPLLNVSATSQLLSSPSPLSLVKRPSELELRPLNFPSLSPKTLPVTDKRDSIRGTACDDCPACDLPLSRPSGIEAVDKWIESERNSRDRDSTWIHPATLSSHPLTITKHRIPRPERPSYSQPSSFQEASTTSLAFTQLKSHSFTSTSSPLLHGGLLTSSRDSTTLSNSFSESEVRAELVLVHPGCAICLDVVKKKGIGILCSGISM